MPAVQEGTIRGFAVTSLARQSDLPNVPTVDESGFPGFEASGWNALLAPAGTPREIIDKINAIVNAFLQSDDGKLQLSKLGITPLGGTPEELQAHLDRERAKWGPIIKEGQHFTAIRWTKCPNPCQKTVAIRICMSSAMPGPIRSAIRTRSISRRRTAPSRPSRRSHDAMGIDRAVLVQSTIYGTDHSLLHDVLKAAPAGEYRGVAIVDDSVSDAELARLHSVGVRGARFNFGGNFKLAPTSHLAPHPRPRPRTRLVRQGVRL